MYRLINSIIFVFLIFALTASNIFAQDFTSAEVQARIHKNINDVRQSVNEVLPYEAQSEKLKLLISNFSEQYKNYQERYFTVIGELPEIIGPDAISQIDKILSEEKGFSTNDLKDDFARLLEKINKEIIPLVTVELERMNEKLARTDHVGKYKGPLGEGQDVLSRRLDELIKKLDKYETNLRKVRTKLLKEESKFSKNAKAYMTLSYKEGEEFKKFNVDMPNINNNPKTVGEVADYGKVFYQRLRKLYLIEEIGTMGLLEQERTLSEIGIEEIKETRSRISLLKDLADKQSLTKQELQSAYDIADMVEGISSAKYEGVGKKPAFHLTLQAHVGGCLNMYFAMVMRDVFHALSGGQFLSQTQRADYKKYQYEDWGKRLQHLLGRYGMWETHVGMSSFIATSHIIRTTLPSTVVMENIFKWSDRWLYGIGGRTLVSGISIYGLSFGIGMKVSEIIGTGLMLKGEFLSDNEKIRAMAWDLYNSSNFSAQAWEQMVQTIVSFGLADVIFDGRTIPKFYDRMKKLNKKTCTYTYEEILKEARDKQIANRDYSRWYSPKSLAKSSVIFIAADFIDNYFVSLFLFPGAKEKQEALLMKKYEALAMAELNALTGSLLLSKPLDSDLEQVFDKYDDLVFLTDIVETLRKEKEAVRTCLSFRDFDKNIASIECLQTLYDVKSSKDSKFINVINKYTINKEDKVKALISSEDYINSEENREQVHDKVVNLLNSIEPTLESTKALQKIITDEVITDGIILQQNIQYAKDLMIESLRSGKKDLAISSLNKLLELYYITEFSPLLSSVINDGLDVSSTSLIDPVIVLDGKTAVSSPNVNKYLQKMIYLFTALYPNTFNTKVYGKKSIVLEMNELRSDILGAIANYLYGQLSSKSSSAELEEANKILDGVRRKMLFSNQESISTLIIVKMTEVYTELGLKKKIDFSKMPSDSIK